jgi:hypothetical protein
MVVFAGTEAKVLGNGAEPIDWVAVGLGFVGEVSALIAAPWVSEWGDEGDRYARH